MLARPYRLTSQDNFEKVKSKGKLIQGNSFALNILFRKDKKPPRFGFVVSNKISNKASIRNKVKRALREGARQNLSYIKPGWDIVVLAKPVTARKETGKIMQEVFLMLKKASLLK